MISAPKTLLAVTAVAIGLTTVGVGIADDDDPVVTTSSVTTEDGTVRAEKAEMRARAEDEEDATGGGSDVDTLEAEKSLIRSRTGE